MRNLSHLPLDVLESSPERLSMRWANRRQLTIPLKPYDRYYRDNNAYGRLYDKVQKIIRGSVGDNWDNIYSRISSLMTGVRFEFNLDQCVGHTVDFPFWSYRNQRWEVRHGYRHSYTVDLNEYIRRIRIYIGMYWVSEFYYVCPISNMLRVVKPKQAKQDFSPEVWRRHYKMLADRRRERKLRKRRPDHILRMINHPEILTFYTKLVGEYKYELNRKDTVAAMYFNAKSKELSGHKKGLSAAFYGRQLCRIDKETFNQIQKLESLRYQIEELEAGRFDSYFESNVYLYSLQKECHHFEQP